jgi:cytoskeletal protein CcmA (bactofilin family)
MALAALALPGAAAAAGSAHRSGDSIVVISGDVTVPRGETVDDVVVVDGDVTLRGHAEGDVVLISGDALVSGRVDGDLVTVGGRARLLPRAFVGGDVRYGDERPAVAGGARVVGDVEHANWPDGFDLLPIVGAFVLWLAVTASTAILGALLILIGPRAADAIRDRSRERVGPVIAIGIAIAICLPLGATIAAVTLVGLPLAIAILLALLPLAAVAYVASAHAVGSRIVGAQRSRILAFAAGLGILRALALIPVLGLLVGLAATVFGLGLIGAAIGAAREAPEPARSPGS